jgi:hypothetical protein
VSDADLSPRLEAALRRLRETLASLADKLDIEIPPMPAIDALLDEEPRRPALALIEGGRGEGER